MEKILLVTDAANDLTPELVAGRPIAIVPATVIFDGKEYKEFFDLKAEEFWDVLERLNEIPVTQQASPTEFVECYRKAIEQGYTHIIVSPVSATASGVLTVATLARDLLAEELGGKLPLTFAFIDSRGYSMIYGRVILETAALIEAGASFDEAVSAFRDRVSRSEALFMVYSLRHIRKSGRIGGMSAFVGEAMGLRPILRCLDGSINPIEKVRGSNKLIPRMLTLVEGFCVDPGSQEFYIVYTKTPAEEIDRAEAEIRRVFAPKDVHRVPICPTVSVNTGPHCMGVVYYGAKRG
ncbi:MAG: DegV family protein [Oscillospiraceae bacterium]|nr:DegV family protein [Oscillospiraceae bacterium]